MRSLVVLAFIALAVAQNPAQDLLTGFNTALNANDAVLAQEGSDCLNAAFGELIQAYTLVMTFEQTQDVQALMNSAVQLYSGLQATLQPVCQPYAETIAAYVAAHGNGQDAKVNAESVAPYIAQEVGLLAGAIAGQDFETAGEHIATIFKLTIGNFDGVQTIEQIAEQIQAEHVNDVATATTQEESIQQLYTAFLTGVNPEADATAVFKLISDINELKASLIVVNAEFGTATADEDEYVIDLNDIEKLVDSVLELIKNNEAGFKTLALMYQPIVEGFEQKHLAYVGEIIFKSLINAPELFKLQIEAQVEAAHGDFVSAGASLAKEFLTVY